MGTRQCLILAGAGLFSFVPTGHENPCQSLIRVDVSSVVPTVFVCQKELGVINTPTPRIRYNQKKKTPEVLKTSEV